MYKTLNYGFKDKLNFDLLEKGLIFQEKCFSCDILLTDEVSLSDCLYFLRYWAICVLQLFVSHIKLHFSIKKKWRQIFKYLDNEKVKPKVFFIIFKELSAVKTCLRPESGPLRVWINCMTALREIWKNLFDRIKHCLEKLSDSIKNWLDGRCNMEPLTWNVLTMLTVFFLES